MSENTTFFDAETFDLSSDEIERIGEILGRKPNRLELELFSILWSEHASYKNSLKWLSILPQKGTHVVVEAGKENAGAVDIGDGLVCVFKIESHNHPCAVQPRLGASTGLRTVTRDVFSMGAKPLAFLNSLRFGSSRRDTTRWLFDEVVSGLADFERGFGIPAVGGEVYFNSSFNTNPIVNNMVIGVAKREDLISAVAKGKGNMIAVIGAPTGRDGIDENVFDMPRDINDFTLNKLSNVDVEVNLFKLIKILNARKVIIGIQPVGAQGIVGAVTEMVARGDAGVIVRTDNIPVREDDLTPRDIIISETWGRMLICFAPDKADEIRNLAKENNIEFGALGEVTDDRDFSLYAGNDLLAQVPVKYLGMAGEAPVYEPQYTTFRNQSFHYGVDDVSEPDHYPKTVKQMISSLNIASKKWITKKFEKSLHAEDLSTKFPSDASIIDTYRNGKTLVATVDCNPSYMTSDPFTGAQIAVAEAVRNIVCAGGKPLAVSDCLNFGNPNDPDAFGAFVASIQGIAKACELFKVPVISGNVSFYNQRSLDGQIMPVVPSPVIGMVGLLKMAEKHTILSFKHKGDMIFLVGRSHNDINGSEYLRYIHGIETSDPPVYNPEEEFALHRAIEGMIAKSLVRSVHDVSNGGLFFTLLECVIPMEYGFDITSDAEIRKDAFLFGESQSRAVVSVSAEKQDKFVDFMIAQKVPFSVLGHVTRGEIRIDDESYGFIGEYKKMFENQFKEWQGGAKQ
ncbi:MAG: phosphoribosylformylglycinamidine synthase subunit PurL [Cytophagaceae bacterium]|nr:phosphoribosylformylglycinamidine synthase subunit PurL [Cytophagaceae bacterium]